jgi:DNA polymerase III subunit chi
MPRVDFYKLPEQKNRESFTYDIATKIRQQKLQLYIYTNSREEANILDDVLWTHKDIGFLPHCLIDAEDADNNGITIGWQGMTAKSNEVLINLSENVPEIVKDFDRIVEIALSIDPYRQQARERYKHYQQTDVELHYTELK